MHEAMYLLAALHRKTLKFATSSVVECCRLLLTYSRVLYTSSLLDIIEEIHLIVCVTLYVCMYIVVRVSVGELR